MINIIDRIYYLWKGGRSLETKLAAYQGYRPNLIIKWKQQTNLPWPVVFKILNKFEIFTAPKIRALIGKIVLDNENLFGKEDCYITGFGNAGKSGDIILYDFSHAQNFNQAKIKKTWDLHTLPPNSTIIFVEDIIGTGTQSVDYILNRLNQVISPSHNPYLLSLCATPKGVDNVLQNTNFNVIHGLLLEEEVYQHYSKVNDFFSPIEKQKILSVNNKLKNPKSFDFDLGLLLAFYFTIPNNAMPILWKEDYPYIDHKGKKRKWTALLPRKF